MERIIANLFTFYKGVKRQKTYPVNMYINMLWLVWAWMGSKTHAKKSVTVLTNQGMQTSVCWAASGFVQVCLRGWP